MLNEYTILDCETDEKTTYEIGVVGWALLKCISKNLGVKVSTGFNWLGQNPSGSCECSNEPSCSTKGTVHVGQLKDHQFSENESAPWR